MKTLFRVVGILIFALALFPVASVSATGDLPICPETGSEAIALFNLVGEGIIMKRVSTQVCRWDIISPEPLVNVHVPEHYLLSQYSASRIIGEENVNPIDTQISIQMLESFIPFNNAEAERAFGDCSWGNWDRGYLLPNQPVFWKVTCMPGVEENFYVPVGNVAYYFGTQVVGPAYIEAGNGLEIWVAENGTVPGPEIVIDSPSTIGVGQGAEISMDIDWGYNELLFFRHQTLGETINLQFDEDGCNVITHLNPNLDWGVYLGCTPENNEIVVTPMVPGTIELRFSAHLELQLTCEHYCRPWLASVDKRIDAFHKVYMPSVSNK